MTYNCGLDKGPYCRWLKEKIAKIEHTKIQAGSDSKPRSPKFISFLSLKGKFSRFKWLITTVLMKVPIVVNEKKKSRKVNNYAYDNSDNSNGKGKPRSPKFINFLLLKGKFSHFKWFTTTLLMKVPIIVDEKKNSQKVNN